MGILLIIKIIFKHHPTALSSFAAASNIIQCTIPGFFLPFSWFDFPAVATFYKRYRISWWNFSFWRVLGTESKPANKTQSKFNNCTIRCSEPNFAPRLHSSSPLRLLFLRFSRFHTNTPDFQYRFGRLGVPRPERLFDVLPHGVPGFRISLPAQTDLQQVTDVLLSKHQECVRQVQADYVVMPEEQIEEKLN